MTGSKAIVATVCAAQGDGLFIRVDAIPEGYAPVKPEGNLNGKPAQVCMHSETGHDHVVDATQAIMYEGPNPSVAYLRLAEDTAHVVHKRGFDTHGMLALTGGAGAVWSVVRQREFDGVAERRAAD